MLTVYCLTSLFSFTSSLKYNNLFCTVFSLTYTCVLTYIDIQDLLYRLLMLNVFLSPEFVNFMKKEDTQKTNVLGVSTSLEETQSS